MNKILKEGLYNLFVIIFVSFDYILNVICNPMLWFSLERSSKEATFVVNKLMEKYNKGELKDFVISPYTVTFFFKDDESITIWIGNYPYSYGNVYKTSSKYSGLISSNVPCRYTKILLHRFIKQIERKLDKKQRREMKSLINSMDVDKVC